MKSFNSKNKISKSLEVKVKRVKMVFTDVDGVLTDGGRYYNETGEILKKFHVRDGMGINILLRNGIKTIIVTKEKSKIVQKWASDVNVYKVYFNSIKKEETLDEISKKMRISLDQIAYIGDDVNDIEISKKVGFSAMPKDASILLKPVIDYVCKSNGGEGAFREIVDLIMLTKFPKDQKLY